ncbi:hypothetical protein [Aliagarivorans taiwanensis]|uniref:hypothetical protein n=1 Tax=Aliagarivorans taiwanensis TaxID=561966 RepID=UPI0004281C9C|nr:hypothetical protein [Aliagarivorans taiwanensis]
MDIAGDAPFKNYVAMQQMALHNPERLQQLVSERKRIITTQFFKKFNPEKFADFALRTAIQLQAKANSGPADMPVISGVPFTDLVVFGLHRTQELGMQGGLCEQQMSQACARLLSVGYTSLMPSLVAQQRLPNGLIHIPSFLELTSANGAHLILDALSALEHTVQPNNAERHRVGEQTGDRHIAYLSAHVQPHLSQEQVQDNIPLAQSLIALSPFGVNISERAVFSRSTVNHAAREHLAGMLINGNNAEVCQNITNCLAMEVPLEGLIVRNKFEAVPFLRSMGNDEVADTLQESIKRQIVDQVLNDCEDKVDHSFDPSAYFDF